MMRKKNCVAPATCQMGPYCGLFQTDPTTIWTHAKKHWTINTKSLIWETIGLKFASCLESVLTLPQTPLNTPVLPVQWLNSSPCVSPTLEDQFPPAPQNSTTRVQQSIIFRYYFTVAIFNCGLCRISPQLESWVETKENGYNIGPHNLLGTVKKEKKETKTPSSRESECGESVWDAASPGAQMITRSATFISKLVAISLCCEVQWLQPV